MSEESILVIDDDETILTIVKATLEKQGFNVMTALNGKDGLHIANTTQTDAIILDRKMPEMDGDETLGQLQQNGDTKAIPVMMLTALNEITDVAECLSKGAQDYIVKPFDHDNLIIRLQNMIKKSANAS